MPRSRSLSGEPRLEDSREPPQDRRAQEVEQTAEIAVIGKVAAQAAKSDHPLHLGLFVRIGINCEFWELLAIAGGSVANSAMTSSLRASRSPERRDSFSCL
jgi:hypothetical protein